MGVQGPWPQLSIEWIFTEKTGWGAEVLRATTKKTFFAKKCTFAASVNSWLDGPRSTGPGQVYTRHEHTSALGESLCNYVICILLQTSVRRKYCHCFDATANNARRRHWFRVVHPSVSLHFTWRDIPVLSEEISMRLDTNIHHVSGHCWEGFQSQGSKFKVMTNDQTKLALMAWACILTVWRCVKVVVRLISFSWGGGADSRVVKSLDCKFFGSARGPKSVGQRWNYL